MKNPIPQKTRDAFGRFLKTKTGFMASALILPTSLKKLAVFLGFYFVVQPMASMLFPRAEDVLQAQGLDPKIAQELAPGKTIYVRRGENPLAKLHAVADSVRLMDPFHIWKGVRDNGALSAYTLANSGFEKNPSCLIYMKPPAHYERLTIDRAKYKRQWKNDDISVKDHYQRVLLHEIRHCSDENHALAQQSSNYDPILAEADADDRSMTVFARERGNPELKTAFYHWESLKNLGNDHDTILYLDAKSRGVATPGMDEMNAANAEAALYARDLGRAKVLQMAGLCAKEQFKAACTVEIAPSTDLARRRIELFQDALDYYLTPAVPDSKPRLGSHAPKYPSAPG